MLTSMSRPPTILDARYRYLLQPYPWSSSRETVSAMAGVGRRTLYRKSVTDDYLNSTPEPGDNEEIVLVRAPRGSNIIEVRPRRSEK